MTKHLRLLSIPAVALAASLSLPALAAGMAGNGEAGTAGLQTPVARMASAQGAATPVARMATGNGEAGTVLVSQAGQRAAPARVSGALQWMAQPKADSARWGAAIGDGIGG